MVIDQRWFFNFPHLLWHGISVYNGHLRGPVTLTLVAECLPVKLPLPVLRIRSVATRIRTSNLLHVWRGLLPTAPPPRLNPYTSLTKGPSSRRVLLNTFLIRILRRSTRFCFNQPSLTFFWTHGFVWTYQIHSAQCEKKNKSPTKFTFKALSSRLELDKYHLNPRNSLNCRDFSHGS